MIALAAASAWTPRGCRTFPAPGWAGRGAGRSHHRADRPQGTLRTPAADHITENGCVYPDSSAFEDHDRIAYLRGHIAAAEAAAAAGVPLRGYFCWSLLDNFEWAHGYKHRFGLIHVDYSTQRRTPRASYHWYRSFVASARRSN